MNTVWHGLMADVAVVAILVIAWIYGQSLFERWPAAARSLAMGLLFGVGAVLTMQFTFALHNGVFYDLRSTLIGTAALFGGPVAGLAAGAVAAFYRLQVGGDGAWSGCLGIAGTVASSLLLHAATRGRALRTQDALVLGLLVALTGVAGTLSLPDAVRADAMAHVVAPVATLLFVSSFGMALALLYEERRRVALHENQTYRTIIESLPDSLNVKDSEGRFIAANPATAALMQADGVAELIGKTDADFYAPPVASRFRQDELDVIAQGVMTKIEQKLPNLDGDPRWLSTLKVPLYDANGAPAGIITHNRDITERKQLETALEQSRGQLSYAMAQMADGVAMFDNAGRLVFCNEQYRDSFPLTRDLRVPGVTMREMLRGVVERGEQLGIPPDGAEEWIDTVDAALREETEEEIHLFDGRWLQVRTRPSPDGACMVVASDVTKIKRAETNLLALTQQLQLLAVTDGLTGLLNRRAFDQALEHEVARSQRSDGWISLLLMDIDRFKAFNDHYGHQEGDAVLRTVSAAFKAVLKRPADIAARYGGEEFVAILPDTDEDGAFVIADAFLAALRRMGIAHAESEKGIVTASIGIACYRPGEHPRLGAELIHWADQALYDAKLAGRDRLTGWRERRGLGAA